MATDYATEATYTAGVMRWNSNGRVPPSENVAAAAAAGFPVDVAACDAAREVDLAAFLAEYRRNPPPLTDEVLFEARAAHGPGVTLVNVITGRRFTT
jgi:hypothetical protein